MEAVMCGLAGGLVDALLMDVDIKGFDLEL